MGAEKPPKIKDIVYVKQPDIKQKLEFYNGIDIWKARKNSNRIRRIL